MRVENRGNRGWHVHAYFRLSIIDACYLNGNGVSTSKIAVVK